MNTPTTVNRLHLIAIKHGLMARRMGMYITSPSKGGSTKNLLALLSVVTGHLYPNSKKGIDTALHHISFILTQSMTAEDVKAREQAQWELAERSRAL